MPLSDVVQLYAPLLGIILMAFWVGGLSSRVKQLERDALSHDDLIKTVARLEQKADTLKDDVDSMKRSVEGIQRTLGNIASGRTAGLQVIKASGE